MFDMLVVPTPSVDNGIYADTATVKMKTVLDSKQLLLIARIDCYSFTPTGLTFSNLGISYYPFFAFFFVPQGFISLVKNTLNT